MIEWIDRSDGNGPVALFWEPADAPQPGAEWAGQQPAWNGSAWVDNLRTNPAWVRYWWLYEIAQRYGKTLPCDVAELRAAMQVALAAAPDWRVAAGINADATDAANAFMLNGGPEFDWTQPPPEFIP